MNLLFAAVTVYLFTLSRGQLAGTQKPELQPAMNLATCTKGGKCTTTKHTVTLDANWRWLRNVDTGQNCYTENTWDQTICKTGDGKKCASKCALEGADYTGTYGITSTGDDLTLRFVTGSNVGSRLYLMDGEDKYAIFKLKNQEFSFEVNVSNLPCGLNGAVYFTQMDPDGGKSKYPGNEAGAKFGTGYCDGQCPRDIKFIGGEANVDDWQPSPNNKNTGTGSKGACCPEMDVWEANSVSQAFTPHNCKNDTYTVCTGTSCGDNGANRYHGNCDMDGCDFASYRLGDHDYYGTHKTVDTSQPFTVVTQFLTSDNTASGQLTEIRRLYVQGNKVIPNSVTKFPQLKKQYDSITDDFCGDVKNLFGDKNDFKRKGGLKHMGEAMDQGMVLALSLWDDYAAGMLWLDSDYPSNKSTTTPGVARGTCDKGSGDPKLVESKYPGASVVFSKLRFGDIGSTYSQNSSLVGADVSSTGSTNGNGAMRRF